MEKDDREKKKKTPKPQRASRGAGRKRQNDLYKAENRDRKNRERRMWRTLRAQPNNEQLAQQLGVDPIAFRKERLTKRRKRK